jgi:hypothetical protein
MRIISFLILFICLTISVIAQPTTFNITVNDTLNLSNISSRPVEFPIGVYSVTSAGSGLSLLQGGYQQIYQVNEQGELIQKRIKYDTARRYHGYSEIIKSSDNNFILTSTRSLIGGTGGNRIFAMKISPDVTDTLWTFFHSDSLFFDTTADLIEADNGDILVSARRNPFEATDSMLGVFIRLNSAGEFINEKIIRERKVQAQESIVQLADGNFLIGGTRGPSFSDLRGFLMKISSEGEILWSQDYPQITECGMSLYNDSTIILSGYIYGSFKPKLLILNSDGGILHNKTYGNFIAGTSNYIGRKVSDGGIVSVGITDYPDNGAVDDGFVMKTDSVGNLLWYKVYTIAESDYFTDFIETSDGGILISGSAGESSANGGQNSWLIKLDANGCLDPQDCEVGVRDMALPDAVTIYPNPAQDWLKIDIEQNDKPYTAQLLDATGRIIQNEQFSGIGTHTLNLSGLAKGIYYCRVLQGNEVVVVEKVVVTSP